MHSSPLAIRGVLGQSLRAMGAALPALTAIATLTAAALVAITAGVIGINWGLAFEGSAIDPRLLELTISGREFAVMGAGLLLALVPLSYAVGATVHAAADPSARLATLLGRVQAKGLQLFWLQWMVNIFALRFVPYAAILLWLGASAAIPVGVLENLGPMAAIERQHALAEGNRMRVYILVLLLTLLALVPAATLTLAIFGPNAEGIGVPPLLRLLLAIPVVTVVFVPTQLLLVVLTRTYLDLTGRAALHAQGAGNVNS